MNLFEIQKARVTENLQRSYGQNELAKALEGEELAKGKKANLGEIREWGGKKYQKTTQGWKEVRGGSKGGENKEVPTSGVRFKDGDYEFVSDSGYSVVKHKGSVIASGSFDRDSDAYWFDHPSFQGQKSFEDGKEALKYFKDLDKEGGEEKSSYSGSDFKLFDSLMWDSLVDRFPDKEAELEEYTLATDAILSKYLKKEVGDYVQTGGGRTFSHNAFDELKTLPKEKYNKMIDQLWAKAKKFGFKESGSKTQNNLRESMSQGVANMISSSDREKQKSYQESLREANRGSGFPPKRKS
jgi:hypothetical protein